MKKILLTVLLALSFSQAGEIFKEYSFNQEKSTISELKEIDRPFLFKDMSNLKAYEDKDKATLLFEQDKLKYVLAFFRDFDLKEKIEITLKDEFRLKKIIYRNKQGEKKVNNVGELLEEIKKEKEKANIFDTLVVSDLLFVKEKNIIMMNYTSTIDRKGSDCGTCDEVKGTIVTENSFLNMIFTEK